MIPVFRHIAEMKAFRQSLAGRVGFVPTMGALHAGHEALLQQARKECDHVLLSIFINPTQFNNPQDLAKYPITWDQDVERAQRNQVDAIFFPLAVDMYPDNYRYKVTETEYSHQLCGKDRPGHFDGVLSVVMKLFNITRPTKAFFGEKDFQQLHLIKGMVEAFFMDLEIVPVPTVREADGLAMSSRNLRLSPEQRALAPILYESLTKSENLQEAEEKICAAGFMVDYISEFEKRRYVAAKLGEVRLIDNVEIP